MQIISIESFKVIGIAIRTSNASGRAAQEIGDLWSRFMAEDVVSKIPNKVDPTIYSMYTEYEGDHTQAYTAILCCRVAKLDPIPEGMIGKTVKGGDYMKTTAKGDLEQGIIVKEWSRIWSLDISRAYTTDFEAFGEKAQNTKDAEVDFFVAVNEVI